jgi:hypothetical protein
MYDTQYNLFAPTIKDMTVYALDGAFYGLEFPTERPDGRYASVMVGVSRGTSITFTGRFLLSSSGDNGYQVILNDYIDATVWGYVWHSDLSLWTQTKPTAITSDKITISAQSELDQLIENNKVILENNLLCARSIQLLDDASIDCPSRFRKDLFAIHKRLIQRNQSIIDSNTTQDITQSHSPNMDTYNQTLVNFMNNPGIGFIISTTAAIIIIAVVAVVSAAIAYKLFKTLNAESKLDLKYSDSLTADLIKYLPPDVHEQLMAENEANQRKANDAINSASGKTLLKTASYLGAGFIGFYILDKFIIKTKA